MTTNNATTAGERTIEDTMRRLYRAGIGTEPHPENESERQMRQIITEYGEAQWGAGRLEGLREAGCAGIWGMTCEVAAGMWPRTTKSPCVRCRRIAEATAEKGRRDAADG